MLDRIPILFVGYPTSWVDLPISGRRRRLRGGHLWEIRARCRARSNFQVRIIARLKLQGIKDYPMKN